MSASSAPSAADRSTPARTTTAGAPAPVPVPRRRPEILAPAGDWDCVRAAVENGADAVYFGLDRFNARMRAHNFTAADLPELMRFLHRRGVRGYVTFNTLVFSNELADAADYIRTLITAGVDAAIVQDVGICRMIRALSPDFPIHISTQMTVTSAAGVQFAHELGAQLVVLARENSIKEIAKIRETLGDSPAQLPLEVFVHGALCVAYSGQCLTSESLGGRSANRGECAQACRLPYDLVADGQPVDLGGRRYLLSPQDLAGIAVLPDLMRLGIASLKIEGRLKSAEYVANLTRVYRQALDCVTEELGHDTVGFPGGPALAPPSGATPPRDEPTPRAPPLAAPLRAAPAPPSPRSCQPIVDMSREPAGVGRAGAPVATGTLRPAELPAGGAAAQERALVAELWHTHRYALEMAFSRGLCPGWFHGLNNQELVHARYGTKRGMFLGKVTRIDRETVAVRLASSVKPGDGIVFDFGSPEDGEEGGRVYSVNPCGADTLLTFGHGDLNFSRIHVGDRVWKTNDPALDRALRASFAGEKPRVLRPISAEVHGRAGTVLTLLLRDELGRIARAESTIPLSAAENQPLTPERLREQFGRLGGTPFRLEQLDTQLAPGLILPLSELNRLRRDAVARLDELRAAPLRWQLVPDGARAAWPQRDEAAIAATSSAAPELIAVIRHLRQLDAVLPLADIRTVYCEFENPKHYREAVTKFHAHRESLGEAGAGRTIWVAPPRIFKPGDEWILKQVRSCEADGYLVRNFDLLRFFADCRRRGDFSLNVANEWSADYFRRQFGLERVTASYDLNIQQLESLLTADDPAALEITIHQHMPMFHMEHCVFCAFLTQGTDYTNCGRPCDSVNLRLRDHLGAEHPVKADAGCRNTVFNARAQTGAEFVGRMIELGARHFRVEFLDEDSDEITRVLGRYRQLITGAISGAELWREFKLINQLGVTRGQMDSPHHKLTPKHSR